MKYTNRYVTHPDYPDIKFFDWEFYETNIRNVDLCTVIHPKTKKEITFPAEECKLNWK